MRPLTIQRVMFFTIFALLFSMAVRIPVDTDTWWHIRSGEHTLNEGMIYEDPFSFTKQGEEWVNHSWGSQIILYGAWEIAGDVGLSLFTAILATAGMGMLYPICQGNVYLRGFVLVIGAATAAVFWSARPQMLSFFLSTVILYILYKYKYDKVDRLWFIPLVILLWGNLHAGFSIGFIFIGGVVAGEILNNLLNKDSENLINWIGLRKLVTVTVVSVAVLVINPYGLKMLLVPFETVSIGALRDFIQEWNSPNFQERQTWTFIFMIFALIGVLGATRKRLDWTDFVLVVGTMFMAFLYGRNISVFAVVATPILTFYVASMLEERGWILRPVTRVTQRQARLNALLLGVIMLGAVVNTIAVLAPESVETAQRAHLPIDVAEFIDIEQPRGPMFNSYNWGGYLMFALPEYPVYVDGRTDLYRDEFLTRYLRAAFGSNGWREILDEDGINMVVVEGGSGLASNLREEAGWTLIYEDDKAVIFTRDEAI